MSENKLIVILGPTAVGKTTFAAHLANKINGEIININVIITKVKIILLFILFINPFRNLFYAWIDNCSQNILIINID